MKSALSLAIFFCVSLFALCPEDPQAHARVWVLREGEITEYNPSSWSPVITIKVRKEFSRDPDRLQITRRGEMLFYLDPDVEFGNPEQHFDRDRIWVWNGRAASTLNRSGTTGNRGGRSRLSLSAGGNRLFWFENEFKEKQNTQGVPLTVSTDFRIWQTDLMGGDSTQVAHFSFPECRCETGVCSETCPEAGLWFPKTGIDDFFFINHWIPGQLTPTFQFSFLYKKSGDKWISARLAEAMEDVLDAASTGGIIVHAIRDGGCCGWDNEGNDQTLASVEGKSVRLFDERQKYDNPNYDVSFYVEKAGLSPDRSALAMTIVSTGRLEEKIRLSDAGKENPAELARIRKELETLPVTEVVLLANPARPLVSLARTSFAGWVNDREILIVENGVLTGFDTAAKTRRTSPVKAPNAAAVFVR